MLNSIKKYILLHKTSDIKRISHRQDLHAIRGISVIVIIFYHADFELFKGGWLGVDLFFVISGYLISNIIISEINSALKQDEETIKLFIQILRERFNENIFFLLSNMSPESIEKGFIDKAESYLLINEDSFKNKICNSTDIKTYKT